MELHDFTKQMNRMSSTWQGITNVDRMPRYYRVVKDLPLNALKEIVDSLLDSSTKMPLPKDFLSLASEWRKSYFQQHGHAYGYELKTPEEEILCKLCFDCGIVKIEHHEPDGFKQLMRCDCPAGANSRALMPQWSSDLAGAFKRVAIEPKWFNPLVSESESLETSEKKLFAKVKDWKRIVIKGEKYWEGLGYQP
jgi:hypothetical protein